LSAEELMMTKTLKLLALGATLPFLLLADLSPEAPLGVGFVREAAAVVGVPISPVSVAGVARRTTRRVVAVESTAAATTAAASSQQQAATAQQQQAVAQQQAATAQQQAAVAQQQAQAAHPAGAPAIGTVVSALPAGCVATPKGGVEYYNCAGVYYRAAFQGNNLVYVVQQP
jgi:type IV secretory pathway TrbL component